MAAAPTFRSKRILVHLDTTVARRPAFTRALRLAKESGGSLRLVDVLAPFPPQAGPQGPNFERLLQKEMKEQLAEAVTEAHEAGVSASAALLPGDVATALVRASVAWRADVLMRSHGVYQATPGPIGPLDSQLVRRCPCPVWFVTQRQSDGEKVVVALVDPEPEEVERHALSVRVVQTAAAVAAGTGGALPGAVVCGDAARDGKDPSGRGLRRTCAARLRRRTAGVAGRAGDGGRTGLAGLVVGNTVERILRQLRGSVLALKPAGFAKAMVEK